MEIMGLELYRAVGEGCHGDCLDMNHVVGVLEFSFDHDEFASCDKNPVLFVDIGGDDNVGNSRFIFER